MIERSGSKHLHRLHDHSLAGGGGGLAGFQLLEQAAGPLRHLRLVLGDMADEDVGVQVLQLRHQRLSPSRAASCACSSWAVCSISFQVSLRDSGGTAWKLSSTRERIGLRRNAPSSRVNSTLSPSWMPSRLRNSMGMVTWPLRVTTLLMAYIPRPRSGVLPMLTSRTTLLSSHESVNNKALPRSSPVRMGLVAWAWEPRGAVSRISDAGGRRRRLEPQLKG